MKFEQEILKVQEDQLNHLNSMIDWSLDEKIEKAKELPMGTIKDRPNGKFIKTVEGWKYHGKLDKKSPSTEEGKVKEKENESKKSNGKDDNKIKFDKLSIQIEEKSKKVNDLNKHLDRFPSRPTFEALQKIRSEVSDLQRERLNLQKTYGYYDKGTSISDKGLSKWQDIHTLLQSKTLDNDLNSTSLSDLIKIKNKIDILSTQEKKNKPMPYGLSDHDRSYFYEGIDHYQHELQSKIKSHIDRKKEN